MWIDRIISDSPDGPQVTDLHERMTVISSADVQKRRGAFDHVRTALEVTPGYTVEVRTEYGDAVSAHRTNDNSAMFDTKSKLPVHEDDRSLGVVGWLNNREQMQKHMGLFMATEQSLRSRAVQDADFIQLAQTRLDHLFALAAEITTAEDALADVKDERSELSEEKREREMRENALQEQFAQQSERQQRSQMFLYAALGLLLVGAAVAFLVALPIGAGICLAGVLVAVVGKFQSKRSAVDNEASSEAADLALGRIDEMFSTQSLTSSRRQAENELAKSWEQWRAIAGNAEPSVLLKDRPRIEELGGHLELIRIAEATAPGDTSLLVGFASLLAELTRRFPAERVPLLVEDLFHHTVPAHHAVLKELLVRASHKRQVVLETADLEMSKWAAIAAVGSDALLITDYDIDVETIIAQIQSAEEENATADTPKV